MKIILMIAVVVLTQDLISQVAVNGNAACPKRTDYDSRCKKKCTSPANCKSKKNRKKKCLCDGVCGLSCIRVGQRCREERNIPTKLRRGTVLLNGKPYQKRVFKFGDTLSYSCRKSFTLSGPSKVRCSGIGKWKPWDEGKPTCKRECRNPGKPRDGHKIGRNYEVGKIVRFRCNPGYTREGPSAITCLSSLTWSGRKPKCKVFRCKELKIPINGRISRGRLPLYQYGDRVYLGCEAGYFRIGSPLVICELEGWRVRGSSREMRCAPKSCGSPGDISNGYVEGTRFTYKSVVKFTCRSGYELRGGSRYRRCLENQKWNGTTPTCEKVDCGDPISLENGEYQSFGTRFGDRQYITCDVGHNRVGPNSIICKKDRKWSYETKCELITCDPSYASIKNGNVKGTDGGKNCTNEYNCMLHFKCHDGYDLIPPSSNNFVCLDSGSWSSQKPVCQPKDCGKPEVPSYGRLTEGSRNFLYPATIQYTCDQSYKLMGVSQRQCLANGLWSDKVPSCTAVCSQLSAPQHGTMQMTSSFGGGTATFSCNDGYDLQGSDTIQCLQDRARWWPNPPSCKPKFCGYPNKPYYGSIEKNLYIWKEFYFPSNVTYQCFPNYIMKGKADLVCTTDGKWQPQKHPSCIANCKDPGSPKHGSRHIEDENSDEKFLANSVITFKCDEGYKLVGSSTVKCQQNNAKWSHENPRCEIVKCPDPREKITNGFIIGSNFEYGKNISLGCTDGFKLTGARQLSCQANGQWNGNFDVCTGIQCDEPPSLEHGFIKDKKANYSYPSKVSYECDEGLSMNDTGDAQCLKYGNWTEPSGVCKVLDCGEPKIQNASIRGNATTNKSKMNISCIDKYILEGENVIECLSNGSWSKLPICRANCKDPGSPRHGSRHIDDENSDEKFLANSVITFKCDRGYKLVGNSTMKCQQNNAKWSHENPRCEIVKCPDPREKITNGFVIGSNFEYGKNISLGCTDGYKLTGKRQLSCQANGEWNGNYDVCIAVDCGDLKIKNALIKGDSTTYKSKKQISCLDGYKLLGNTEVECLEDGSWSKPPKCRGSCDDALGMENGEIGDQEIKSSSPATGYENSKGRYNGMEWCGSYKEYYGEVSILIRFSSVVKIKKVLFQRNNSRPSHQQVSNVLFRYYDAANRDQVFQHMPADGKHYSIQLKQNDKYLVTLDSPIQTSFFEIAVFKEHAKPDPVVCGRFEIFGCEEHTTCDVPNNPVNGETLGMLYKQSEHAMYSCDSGFKLENNEAQTCSSDGRWTGNVPKCIKDDRYLGCYKDSNNRVLNAGRGSFHSTEDCINGCKRLTNVNVIGLQYSFECRCGYQSNIRGEHLKANDEDCYMPCSKDSSRKCGGPWRNTVYNIRN